MSGEQGPNDDQRRIMFLLPLSRDKLANVQERHREWLFDLALCREGLLFPCLVHWGQRSALFHACMTFLLLFRTHSLICGEQGPSYFPCSVPTCHTAPSKSPAEQGPLFFFLFPLSCALYVLQEEYFLASQQFILYFLFFHPIWTTKVINKRRKNGYFCGSNHLSCLPL